MKKLILITTLLSFLSQYDAKADNVIIKGDTLWTIFFSPFDNYSGVVKLREKLADYGTRCTEDNCSFLSTWKIVNKKLMLAKIENCECNDKKKTANLKKLFGNRLQRDMLEADWYTGEIWVTKDQPNSWGGMFAASWPSETQLIVKKGVVISIKNFVYPKPIETIYYKNRDSLYHFIYTHINWTKMHDLQQRNTAYFFRFEQDTNGYLLNLKYVDTFNSHQTFDENEMIELNRVLGLIEWPLFYYHGEPVKSLNGIDIVLSKNLQEIYSKRN